MRLKLMVVAMLAIGLLWAAGVAGAAATGQALRLTVWPATGLRKTHFRVSYTAERTGLVGADSDVYRVVVFGGSSPACESIKTVPVPATLAGQRVHLRLRASGPSHLWCKGWYTGRLEELIQPICGPAQACPMDAQPAFIAVLTLKTFHFRVR